MNDEIKQYYADRMHTIPEKVKFYHQLNRQQKKEANALIDTSEARPAYVYYLGRFDQVLNVLKRNHAEELKRK